MTLKLIDDYLNKKLRDSEEYFVISFFDLRVKYNLSEEDTDRFLFLIRTRLENENYKVYFTGAKFEYENSNRTVQDNELMIAIK